MKIKRTKPGSKSSEAKHEIVKTELNGNNVASVPGGAVSVTGGSGAGSGGAMPTGGDGTGTVVDGVVGNNKKFPASNAGGQTNNPPGPGAGLLTTGQNNSLAANNNSTSSNNGGVNSSPAVGNSASGTTTTPSLMSTGGAGPTTPGGHTHSSASLGSSSGSNKRNSSGHRRDKGSGGGKEKGGSGGSGGGNSISQRDKAPASDGVATSAIRDLPSSGPVVTAGAAGSRTGMLCACPEAASGTAASVALQNGSSLGPPCGSALCVRLRGTAGSVEGKMADLHDRTGPYDSRYGPAAADGPSVGVGAGKPSSVAAASNSDSSMTDAGSSSPPAKKMRGEPREMHDACVGTSVGTITEPDCLGPCEPGTSVTLEGIVWHETEGGVLVVNVTWRGKTYVGTLLDCTRHDWAPPR